MSKRGHQWEILKETIEHNLSQSGHYMLHHPSELRVLEHLNEKGVRRLASRNHWLVQFHLHGEFIEFFPTVRAYY